MDTLIGKRINIEYGDQNYHFESILPRKGTIVSRYKTQNVDDWYLIDLDEPFEFNERINKQLLIRSRWKGITLNDETSVFVLLIPDANKLNEEYLNINDFERVVWGETKLC